MEQESMSEDIHWSIHMSTPYFSGHQFIWIGINVYISYSSTEVCIHEYLCTQAPQLVICGVSNVYLSDDITCVCP